jgi:hypothetical protein
VNGNEVSAHMVSLKKATAETDAFLAPLIKAMELEGSLKLRSACDARTPSPHCPYYAEFPEQVPKLYPRTPNALLQAITSANADLHSLLRHSLLWRVLLIQSSRFPLLTLSLTRLPTTHTSGTHASTLLRHAH